MPKITDPTQVKYIALEGGGGKGYAYLGAVLALEELGILPEAKKERTGKVQEVEKGQIIGISGASAGAITALMLAIGMNSDDIKKEVSRDLSSFYDDPTSESLGAHRKVTSSNEQEWFVDSQLTKTRKEVQLIVDRIVIAAKDKIVKILTIHNMLKQAKLAIKLALRGPLSVPTITKDDYDEAIPKKSILQQNAILSKMLYQSNLGKYILNLIFDFGLFDGTGVRNYFTYLVNQYLTNRFTDGGRTSFQDLFKHKNISLVVTGTNLTLHRPGIFSKELTPDFPVVEAVGLSMSLPLFFKPVYVDSPKSTYRGFWCDGGVLNNLPMHAFDQHDESLNPNMLALRLTPGKHPALEENKFESLRKYCPSDDKIIFVLDRFLKYLDDLFETVLYHAEEGQIRSPSEAEQTIHLYTFDLSLTEFSPPLKKRVLPVLFAHKSVYDYFGKAWSLETHLNKIMKFIDE